VVLDEAQRIKNPEAEISQVCKALHRVRSIALTGTPLENSTEDLSSILEFVLKRRVTGLGMRSVLGQVQLRRRKSEVLADLPSKTEIELPVPLSHEQRHAYERAEREGVIALKRGTISIESLLALLTRLKQICNFDPVTGVSAKVEDLRGRLREVVDSGQKALVFTQFSGESGANRLAGALGEFQPLVFTGQLSPSQRTAVLDQFNEDEEARVLILSLRAGGLGLNLQAASYVFHFDRWWNPAVEAQAEARAYRIGQERPVFIYRYVSPGTVEEKIAELLEQKAALFDYIVEGVPANLSLGWDRSELLKVIGFRQGE